MVGHLGLAHLARGRARVGALLVAEELVLEQGLRDGGAVDGHEGPLRAGRELVKGAAHQLLPGAALSGDQHGGIGGGGALDGEHRLLQGRVLPQDPGEADLPLIVVSEENELGGDAPALHHPVE